MNNEKGDLLAMARQGLFDVIVHGCNCFCNMGKGIALQVRNEYPEAFAADCETVAGNKDKLGTYTVAQTKDGFTIVNAYTQYHYNHRDNREDLFEYDEFEIILANLLHDYGHLRIGLPYIGMGLAGGDRTRILAYIEDFAQKVEDRGGAVTLVEFA